MRGAIPLLCNMPSWLGAELKRKGQGQLCLYLYSNSKHKQLNNENEIISKLFVFQLLQVSL
jgi:hypothetical protein